MILKDDAVTRQSAHIGSSVESIFGEQRVNSNPRMWKAVNIKTAHLIRDLEIRFSAKANLAFGHVTHGFSADLDDAQISDLQNDPRVLSVFPDATGIPAADPAPWYNRPGFGYGYTYTYGWNLYAIGAIRYLSDTNPAAGSPSYRTSGGYPVKGYVIDAGIQPHDDLNFTWQMDHISFDCHSNVGGSCINGANGDGSGSTYSYQPVCDSHGTHVAGIIGAKRQNGAPVGVEGVAPDAQLVSVRVINYCTNGGTPTFPYTGLVYTSSVIGAINWVAARSEADGGNVNRIGAVANISILWQDFNNSGNDRYTYIDANGRAALTSAVKAAVNKGVFFSFAAGNSQYDTCHIYPASIGASTLGAMAVGAIAHEESPMQLPSEDKYASHGPCVEIWAPGQSVQSTGAYPGTVLGNTYGPPADVWGAGIPLHPSSSNLYPGQHYYFQQTGSSMAAPHVAGAALLVAQKYKRERGYLPSPAQVEQAIVKARRNLNRTYFGYSMHLLQVENLGF